MSFYTPYKDLLIVYETRLLINLFIYILVVIFCLPAEFLHVYLNKSVFYISFKNDCKYL